MPLQARPPNFVRPFPDFQAASRVLFAALRTQIGLPTWMMLRVADKECLVAASQDELFDIQVGLALAWKDTFSARVLRGELAQVIPDVAADAAASATTILHALPIGAHLCVPMQLGDGIGCLVGMDRHPCDASLAQYYPLATMVAGVLATLWVQESRAIEAVRRAERAELDSMLDTMTGAYNRRGWRRLLKLEEGRCARGKSSAGIVLLDLDYLKQANDKLGHSAGDELIVRTAQVVRETIRQNDVLARLGGDEFAVLMPDIAPTELSHATLRIRDALAANGIAATFGYSWREASRTLPQVQEAADAVLIRAKTLRPKQPRYATAPASAAD